MPPLTVASLAIIRHSRPDTRPIPVTMPADGAAPSYNSQAARGDSSRNGELGSSSRSTRSRTNSFPCSAYALGRVHHRPGALEPAAPEALLPGPDCEQRFVETVRLLNKLRFKNFGHLSFVIGHLSLATTLHEEQMTSNQ